MHWCLGDLSLRHISGHWRRWTWRRDEKDESTDPASVFDVELSMAQVFYDSLMLEIAYHSAFFLPFKKFSKMMPATVRPLPTPAPSPMRKPARWLFCRITSCCCWVLQRRLLMACLYQVWWESKQYKESESWIYDGFVMKLQRGLWETENPMLNWIILYNV